MKGFGALKSPSFTRYLSARFLAVLAVQMQSVAVGWQIYAITHDPLDLGLVGLSQFLPFVFLVLPAGHAADHYNRQRILASCYGLEVFCGLMLLAFTLSGLEVVWPVFAVMTLFGMARAFSMPTSQAILPNLVPSGQFGNAVALNSSTFQVATIAGPTLGGLLYLAGPEVVYSCVAIFLSVSVVLMAGVKLLGSTGRDSKGGGARPEPSGSTPASGKALELVEAQARIQDESGTAAAAGKTREGSWHEVLEGLRFVKSRPVVLGAISLDLFAVLFGGATALLPAYAHDVLHVGPTGLGLLRTAPGLGAALIAVVLAFAPITRHVGRWMFAGVALFGAATIVFGLSKIFALSLFCLFLLGVGDMVSVYIRHMLIQLETPDAIRGRVSAVNAVFIGASNELGEFESGVTAKGFGLIRSVVIGGCATLVVAGVWARLFPSLKNIDRFPGATRD